MTPQAEIANTIMHYLMGGLLALIPLLAWGYIFYKKQKEDKKQLLISFFAGVFSVIPIFVVLGDLGDVIIDLGALKIQGLMIYEHIQTLALTPGPMSLLSYVVVSIFVFFLIYLISALITFILAVTTGETTIASYKKTLKKSLEEPFIFLTLGIIIGLFAYTFRWSLQEIFWKSMMIGIIEEYAKHLLVRFVDEDKFKRINDVITFSIMVALGFAFLENILYFVDKIWLSPCHAEEVQQALCLYDESKGMYVPRVGVLMAPFIFRSLFSTLAHILFSGLFGYFYGLAHFARCERKLEEKQKGPRRFLNFLHSILHLKKDVLYHRQKILEGALLAMFLHGMFDFILDERLYEGGLGAFTPAPLLVLIPPLMIGYTYLSYLYTKPENKKEQAVESCTL